MSTLSSGAKDNSNNSSICHACSCPAQPRPPAASCLLRMHAHGRPPAVQTPSAHRNLLLARLLLALGDLRRQRPVSFMGCCSMTTVGMIARQEWQVQCAFRVTASRPQVAASTRTNYLRDTAQGRQGMEPTSLSKVKPCTSDAYKHAQSLHRRLSRPAGGPRALTVSTPFSYDALMRSGSALSGRRTARTANCFVRSSLQAPQSALTNLMCRVFELPNRFCTIATATPKQHGLHTPAVQACTCLKAF